MTEYFDIRCTDDLDAFARDVAPLEVLGQDLYHFLITDKMSLLQDPDWGFGLESYLGKPLPATFTSDVENAIRNTFSDRVSDARCTVTPIDGEVDTYRMDLAVECDSGFLDVALTLSPDGILRLS